MKQYQLDELKVGGLYYCILSSRPVLIIGKTDSLKGKFYNYTTSGFDVYDISNGQLTDYKHQEQLDYGISSN
jgi:hypothetical protein